jgi:hypothetical protein
MKYISLFEQFVNEKTKMQTAHRGGKKVESTWAGTTDSLKELIDLIENAPKTLEFIQVPTNTNHFDPDVKRFNGPITGSKKKQIVKIVKQLDKDHKKEGEPVTKYKFESFTGAGGKDHESDSAYIDFKTEKKGKFNRDMASGKYGSLD